MSKVAGKVTKVESKGLYIKLENGKDAFLPKENMFIGKKKKLEEIFSVDFVIKAAIENTRVGLEYLTGASIRVDFAEGYPAVINDEVPYQVIREVIEKENIDYIELEEAYLYGEDFSFFSRLSPINYSFLGLRNEEKNYVSGLHTPTFNFDEKILKVGVQYYLGILKYYNE